MFAALRETWKNIILDGEPRDPLEDVLIEHFIGPQPKRHFIPVKQKAPTTVLSAAPSTASDNDGLNESDSRSLTGGHDH